MVAPWVNFLTALVFLMLCMKKIMISVKCTVVLIGAVTTQLPDVGTPGDLLLSGRSSSPPVWGPRHLPKAPLWLRYGCSSCRSHTHSPTLWRDTQRHANVIYMRFTESWVYHNNGKNAKIVWRSSPCRARTFGTLWQTYTLTCRY